MSESKDLQWMFEGREPVRAHLDDQGNPWFVAKDVCRVLGISDHFQAVEALEKEEGGRYTIPTPSISGQQEMLVVSEFGLYALIFKSRKEQATAFRRWLSTTVLPEIRKTGGYRIAELQAEVNRLQEEVMPLQNCEKGNSRDLAAASVGMSGEQYRRIKVVMDSGNQEIIDKMNSGELSVRAAYMAVKGKWASAMIARFRASSKKRGVKHDRT